jgi:hypothetical protein
MVYRADQTDADEWKPVAKTLADGYGDCEDFALVTKYFADGQGIQSWFISTQNGEHVQIILEHKGTYATISNGILSGYRWTSLEGAVETLGGILI